MWQVKKIVNPKICDNPVAKRDSHGNLLTTPEAIKSLYVKTYSDKLGEKPIDETMRDLKVNKELSCKEKLKLAKQEKSPEESLEKIDNVLKSLKKNKARDPVGLANELFQEGVIGKDIKSHLLT